MEFSNYRLTNDPCISVASVPLGERYPVRYNMTCVQKGKARIRCESICFLGNASFSTLPLLLKALELYDINCKLSKAYFKHIIFVSYCCKIIFLIKF